LGYAFPQDVVGNKFFEEFIAGFKRSGVDYFTPLQCQMLDELIHNRAFQVTSTDVSCGSGKTSLTVGATIGLFEENDKIIFVNKPGRGESSLTKELKQLVEKFSGPSMMRVSTILNETDAVQLVPESDVIITNCIALGNVLETVVAVHQLMRCSPSKVHIIFDEAHKIFNHESLLKMSEWAVDASCSRPALSHVEAALTQFYNTTKDMESISTVPVFLSAVGDFAASNFQTDKVDEKKLSSSEVVEMCIGKWMQTYVTKLVNSGNNSERNYNCIFKIYREGAIQIAGTDPSGYVLVYEAMMEIALKRLVNGRMLFIVRRQQVDTFSAMLDAKIAESGPFFSYTADRDYWNAIDKDTMKPKYNIVIVREDELDDLEGVNIDGLRAVYLFSLGRTKNLYQKMQGLGRVGRLGQEASYCFVMIDCATKRNGAIEAESSPFLLDAMNSNGTSRPQIINVYGAKALDAPSSNIPTFQPNFQKPTPLQLEKLQKVIKNANLPQVCKFMQYSRKTGKYECPWIEQGKKCAWYHPKPSDFAFKSTALKCCSFNTSYCKKGVFREAKCSCINSMVPIAPVTTSTLAWTAANPIPSSVLSLSQFPKLGEEQQKASSTLPKAVPILSAKVEEPPCNPRMKMPVCRFAVMDMYKCKARRQGKLCQFRHPEEAEDKVTDEEYLETLELSIENLNKNRTKYGQKPLVFSKDLYHKYNYPGRHKSNLVKPIVKQVLKTAPVKTLASVLNESVRTESDPAVSSHLFCALKNAFVKKEVESVEVASAVTSEVKCNSVIAPNFNEVDAESVDEKCDFTEVVVRKRSSSVIVDKSVHQPSKKVNYFDLLTVEEDDNSSDDEKLNADEVSDDVEVKDEVHAEELQQQEPEMSPAVSDLLNEYESNAYKLLESKICGVDLVDHLQFSPTACDTTAAALTTALLADQVAASFNYKLFSDDNYGLVLKHLLKSPTSVTDRVKAQADMLEAVELYCAGQNFIKVAIKSGEKYIIDVLFRLMYAYELVDEEGFFAWHEKCDFAGMSREDVKLKAVSQTTEFFGWLLQDDECEQSTHYDDKYVAPPTIVEEPLEEEPKAEEGLSKAERKALKQQRRQEKLASRGDCGNSKLSQIASGSSVLMMSQ
jgi:hypothetical protein